MGELKPLLGDQEKEQAGKPIVQKQGEQKPVEKVEMTQSLLKTVNGELCFELQFGNKSLIISQSKCSQLIPEFKKMSPDQQEGFLMQAAIFGANPFNQEVYPVPFKIDGNIIYAPVISTKKYVEKGMQNPKFDGMKSGVVIEKKDGSFDFRRGQVYGKNETLSGGWCEIFIKGIREPIFRSVNLNEIINRKNDGTPNRFWNEKTAMMCEKVAQKQAMEIAMQMPKTYIEDEIVIDIDHEDLTDQKSLPANNEDFFKK